MNFTAALLFIATLLISALSIYVLLAAILQPRRIWSVRLLVASTGLGPILLSFLLTAALTLFPGQLREVYLFTVLAGLLSIALVGHKGWHKVVFSLRYLAASIKHRKRSLGQNFGILALLALLASLFGLAIALPIHENDALEYAGSARRIFELRSAVDYPFVDSSKTGGYYGPWSHPLGYVSLQVWGFLIQGTATTAGVIKLIGPLFALYTAITVWIWIGGFRKSFAVWGAVVLLATPLYFFNASANQIDPMRLFAFFVAGMLAPMFWGERKTLKLSAYGVILGFAIYTHSLGLVILPIVATILFLKSPYDWQTRGRQIAITCTTAVAVVIYRLVDNIFVFGSPIADVGAVPVYALRELDWQGYFRQSRDILTLADRILYGLLGGFTRPVIYGASYWLLALAVILLAYKTWRRWWRAAPVESIWRWLRNATSVVDLAALVLLIFAAMVLASVAAGLDAFIKNIRYPLTIQPYLALFAVAVLGPMIPTRTGKDALPLRQSSSVRSFVLLAIFAGGLLSIPSYYAFLKLRSFDAIGWQILDGDTQKISVAKAGYMKVPSFATENLPLTSKILTFRQSDLSYYGRHKFLSDIDPILIPFYQLKDTDAAHAELDRLEITHLLVPDYPIPTVYNSEIDRILADPTRVALIFQEGGTKLFALRKRTSIGISTHTITELPVNEEKGDLSWTAWKPLQQYAAQGHFSTARGVLSIDHRPLVSLGRPEARIYSGRGPIELAPSEAFSAVVPRVKCARTYRVIADITGEGWVELNVVLYPGNKNVNWIPVWQGYLNGSGRKVSGLFDAFWDTKADEPCSAAEARIVARLFRRGQIGISHARIEEIQQPVKDNVELARYAAKLSGWHLQEARHAKAISWGLAQSESGKVLFIGQPDRRNVSLMSRWLDIPPGTKLVELSAQVSGRGLFKVHFYCSSISDDRRPRVSLLASNEAYAPRQRVTKTWLAPITECEDKIATVVQLSHAPSYRGTADQYGYLNLSDVRINAVDKDDHKVTLLDSGLDGGQVGTFAHPVTTHK